MSDINTVDNQFCQFVNRYGKNYCRKLHRRTINGKNLCVRHYKSVIRVEKLIEPYLSQSSFHNFALLDIVCGLLWESKWIHNHLFQDKQLICLIKQIRKSCKDLSRSLSQRGVNDQAKQLTEWTIKLDLY